MVAYETKESVKQQKQIIYKKEASELREERLAYDQSKKLPCANIKTLFCQSRRKDRKRRVFFS